MVATQKYYSSQGTVSIFNGLYVIFLPHANFHPIWNVLRVRTSTVVVLDNAPYHEVRDENYIDPYSLKRRDLISTLREVCDIQSITAVRDGVNRTFPLDAAARAGRGGKNSPTVVELRKCLAEWLPDHPEFQKSQLRTLFDRRGDTLLFTPPYTPAVQPIELSWAYAKSCVRRKFKFGRTIAETKEHLMDGFYGDGTQEFPGCSPEICKNQIRHSQDECNLLIDEDEQLSGNLENLVIHDEETEVKSDESENADALDAADTYFGDHSSESSDGSGYDCFTDDEKWTLGIYLQNVLDLVVYYKISPV